MVAPVVRALLVAIDQVARTIARRRRQKLPDFRAERRVQLRVETAQADDVGGNGIGGKLAAERERAAPIRRRINDALQRRAHVAAEAHIPRARERKRLRHHTDIGAVLLVAEIGRPAWTARFMIELRPRRAAHRQHGDRGTVYPDASG